MKVNEDLAVLDVNSGAVHLLDQAAYDILGIFNGNNDEETVAALKDFYEETELREILGELHELMEQGLLFSPEFDVPETFATEPVLKSLCLHVAHDCNLRCKYCFAGTGDFGGKRELAYLTAEQNFRKGEESVMKDTTMELLIIVSNQGHNDMVMDAARAAGAYGGTVLHARGTGVNRAELFFGVPLASEKDVTLIVTQKKQKNAIMQAVMQKAGMDTPAQAILFSLPVTDAAGLHAVEEDNG